MRARSTTSSFLPLAVIGLLLTWPALAGGPLNLNPNDPDGVERWPNGGANIPFNMDGVPVGGVGAFALGPLTWSQAEAAVLSGFGQWEGVATATATYSNNGPLGFDVDVTNYNPFVLNLFFGTNTSDGVSPIVLDVDGSIFIDLFGSSGVLGFASPDTRDANGTPIEAVCFLNGGAILGGFPVVDFDGVIVHEFGHYSGLAHTVANGESVFFGDESGPTPFDTYGASPINLVETMYPFAGVGVAQFATTPHADDIGTYSFLYPGAGFFSGSATITGTVLAPNGMTPLTGINVVARNVANPFVDAVSAISGDRGAVGAYTLNGLTPGASYTVHIDQILAGGFSTPPISLPGPEEFYSGAAESNNVDSADPPSVSETVSAAAGGVAGGVDVILNLPSPGDPLQVGDDGFVELFLPFDFCIKGQQFGSVFVNANGSLTFGAGDTDFTESAGELLGGPPRIAALWDDLSPFNLITGAQQGLVTFDQTPSTFTVIFEDVPEFLTTGSNSFEIELSDNSDRCGGEDDDSDEDSDSDEEDDSGGDAVTIVYGGITALDGLAGVSGGGAVASGFEAETDLSALNGVIRTKNQAAVYELFGFSDPNDLGDTSHVFKDIGKGFKDRFEKNDSLRKAKKVALPFDTVDTKKRFTEIRPAGGDVDYFRFRAEEGQFLVAEVVTGQIDSVLGVFLCEEESDSDSDSEKLGDCDSGATLLATDDDSGQGFLSRVVRVVPVTGTYAVAVSTFPDFDFDGDGNLDPTFGQGRYVLDVATVDELVLTLGDDSFEEVALGFDFPFQGGSYSSVFVNSNGSLTMGQGDTDFSESVPELLNGPPRIAALWDDLSPNQGGLVVFDSDSSSATVSFIGVPEFFSGNSNTFTISLSSDGSYSISYGDVDASDGIAGTTEGGGAADPGPVDLSTGAFSALGTTYEVFNLANPFDLTSSSVLFSP